MESYLSTLTGFLNKILKYVVAAFAAYILKHTFVWFYRLLSRYMYSFTNIAFVNVSYTNANDQIVHFIFSISQLSFS